MKPMILLIAAGTLVVAASAAVEPASSPSSSTPAAPAAADPTLENLEPAARKPDGPPIAGLPLRNQMVLIQAALSRVSSDVGVAARKADALASVEEAQRRVIEAKRAKPPRFDERDETAQRKHDAAFRSMMAKVLGELSQLEIAIVEGEDERARASLNKLLGLQKLGHQQFQPPRPERTRPAIEMTDKVKLTADQRAAYSGAYEFKDVGFRLRVFEQDGHLFVESFGQPSMRMYAMGDHRFKIAVSAESEVRFDLGDDGVAQAVVISPGGGRPEQRIERVK